MNAKACSAFFLVLVAALAASAFAPAAEGPTSGVENLELEELLAATVSSVSRKDESLFDTAVAIGVLSGEEIRRTGVSHLPDALRYATGVHVSQHSSRSRAISIRGFSLDAANKLEVLMDGRSLYTPFFSGVQWERPDYVLADLDRIEVIRGSDATMWGANAVNGVIHILTKGSEETVGSHLRTVIGAPESFAQSARVGMRLSDATFARVYFKYSSSDDTWLESGLKSKFDMWEVARLGFRSDYLPDEDSRLQIAGEVFTDKLQINEDEWPLFDGGHLLARWERRIDASASYELQAYYDRYDRLYPGTFDETRETAAISGKYRYEGVQRHDVVCGFGYRYSWDETRRVSIPYLEPANEGFAVASVYLQDEIALNERTDLILGGTLEHNSLVERWEFQPSVRMKWSPASLDMTLWGGVSRAVRTPARADTDLRWIVEGFAFRGTRDFLSERALSYEVGHRQRFGDRFSSDIALFNTSYDDLPTVEPQGGGAFLYRNLQRGRAWGGEISLEYKPNYWSRYELGYSRLRKSFRLKEGSLANPFASAANLGNDPENMATFSAFYELRGAVELSGHLRYVDELPSPAVPSYLVADLRLAWAPQPGLELALVGRNLLDHRHPEYRAASPNRREVSRSIQAQASFEF